MRVPGDFDPRESTRGTAKNGKKRKREVKKEWEQRWCTMSFLRSDRKLWSTTTRTREEEEEEEEKKRIEISKEKKQEELADRSWILQGERSIKKFIFASGFFARERA